MLAILLYLVSFLRTLIVILVIVFIIRWLQRVMAPTSKSSNNSQQAPREGETTIRFDNKGKKVVNKDEGEYVDFEEVD